MKSLKLEILRCSLHCGGSTVARRGPPAARKTLRYDNHLSN